MRPLALPLLFFIVLLTGCTPGRTAPEHEVLIVWGRQEHRDECSVWMVDPAQEVAEQVLNVETCGLKVVDINNTPHLIYKHWDRPGEMTIYAIHAAERKLSVKEVIALDGIDAMGSPQWDKEGTLYFSSTVEEGERVFREQLFRLKPGSETAEPLIRNATGIASGPLISPDGRHLAYWTFDGEYNLSGCVTGCGYGDYHVFDLESNRDIALLPLIRQYGGSDHPYHNKALWSPTGQFLAFQIGVFGEAGIIIFDVLKTEIVAHLQSEVSWGRMEVVHWVSDTELVYMAERRLTELGITFLNQPYSYSLESQSSRELLPNLLTWSDKSGYISISFYDFTVTANGTDMVGVMSAAGEGEGLLIAEDVLEGSESSTFYSEEELPHSALSARPFINPVWSRSGKWTAYFSRYPLAGNDYPDLAELYIIDRTGEEIAYGERITDIVATLRYAWVLSR